MALGSASQVEDHDRHLSRLGYSLKEYLNIVDLYSPRRFDNEAKGQRFQHRLKIVFDFNGNEAMEYFALLLWKPSMNSPLLFVCLSLLHL